MLSKSTIKFLYLSKKEIRNRIRKLSKRYNCITYW